MKSYTDLEQSKVLAEILPLESADMCYLQENGQAKTISPSKLSEILNVSKPQVIPCWSLAALLGVLPNYHITNNGITGVVVWSMDIYSKEHPNLIDACVAMIELLHKQKLL